MFWSIGDSVNNVNIKTAGGEAFGIMGVHLLWLWPVTRVCPLVYRKYSKPNLLEEVNWTLMFFHFRNQSTPVRRSWSMVQKDAVPEVKTIHSIFWHDLLVLETKLLGRRRWKLRQSLPFVFPLTESRLSTHTQPPPWLTEERPKRRRLGSSGKG